MSKTPNFDLKVKTIIDNLRPSEQTCELTGERWQMDEEEIGWYKKFNVPPSPFSPKARMWHLSSYMTTYQWWWNKHFDSGAPVLTYLHPKAGIRVLPDKEWFEKDFSSTNKEFTTQKPFFEIFRELQLGIPVNATRNVKEPERSIATVSMGDVDSYFVAGCRSKKSYYGEDVLDQEGTIDANGSLNLTDCYHINHSQRMHGCKFAYECFDCMGSSFIFDCRNCENCFGAWNKRNAKYLWWNEQLTEEEWEKRYSEVNLGSWKILSEIKKKFFEVMAQQAIWPADFNQHSENCSGEYMTKCTNCKMCVLGVDATDNWGCIGMYNARGNAFSIVIPGDNNYQSGMVGETSNCKFSSSLIRSDDLEYSFNCYNCEHCFGCVGLRHKKFHIFNKEYYEDEYWQKVDELKCSMLDRGEYGRPLPTNFSFGYFPESGIACYLGVELNDEEWTKSGMLKFDPWDDGAYGEMRIDADNLVDRATLPDHVDEMDDEWTKKPIMDEGIKRPFAYLKPEMEFYRQHKIAPPRDHFTARIRGLMRASNALLPVEMECKKCSKKMIVNENPTFKNRKIYCHECYLGFLEQYG
ncbi:MAG: hypothetical protein ABIH21_01800 [Patescibacteria group bacterium]